jgi:hypothetical protein
MTDSPRTARNITLPPPPAATKEELEHAVAILDECLSDVDE